MEIITNLNLYHLIVLLFLLGLFLLIAGLEIIHFKIKEITVLPGPKTWSLGLFFIILGLSVFVYTKYTFQEDKKSTNKQITKNNRMDNQDSYKEKSIMDPNSISSNTIRKSETQKSTNVDKNRNNNLSDKYSAESTLENAYNEEKNSDNSYTKYDNIENKNHNSNKDLLIDKFPPPRKKYNNENIDQYTCVIDSISSSELSNARELTKQEKYRESILELIEIRDGTEKECVRAKSQIYIGDAYKKLKMYPEARAQLIEAVNYFRTMSKYTKELAISLVTLGEVELKAKDYKMACLYLPEARSIFHSINKERDVIKIDGYLETINEC